MPWQDHYTPTAFREAVRQLVYEEGLSASKAAARLNVTKNVVIRQMQWLKGVSRSTVTFPDSVWPSTTSRNNDADAKPEPTYGPIHLTKIDRGYSHCRAPLWPDFIRSTAKVDPSEHMLCGQKTRDGSSYCAEHHALFYPAELQKRVTRKKTQEVQDNSRLFG